MLRHARLLRPCRSLLLPPRPTRHSTPTPLLPSTWSWSCSLCRITTRRTFTSSSSDASSTPTTDPSSTPKPPASAASDPWSTPSSPSDLLPAELRTGDAVKDRATLRSLAARAARAEQDEEQANDEDERRQAARYAAAPPKPRLKLPPNYDPLNDELELPAEEPDPELPISNPPNTAFPLPPLPPLPAGSDFFPTYTPAYHSHRSGSSLDCFKHAVLLQLYGEMTEAYSTAITYVGVGGGGGGVAADISGSILRQSGVDCVYEYGRWWARLARRTHDTTKHSLIPLMQAVRAVNGGSKLDRGFRYYPGNAAVVRHAMRPHDRAVFFESDKQLAHQLVEYFNTQPTTTGHHVNQPTIPPLRAERADKAKDRAQTLWALDDRVVVHPFNGYASADERSGGGAEGRFNPVVALGRPLTSHALFHFDLTKERYENVQHMQHRLGTHVLPSLFNQYPNATFVTSVPLYGDTLPYDVVRWHLRGHRDVMMVRWNGQQAVRLRGEEEDEARASEGEEAQAQAYDDGDFEAEGMEMDETEDGLADDVDDVLGEMGGKGRLAAGDVDAADEDEDDDVDDLFDDEDELDAAAIADLTAGDLRGDDDALQGGYVPFNGPKNMAIPIDEPWGVAMIIVKPPRGFDAAVEAVQDDMAEVRTHIPHVGLVHVSEGRLAAEEEAAGDGVRRSEEERQGVRNEVVNQMRRFEEPEYVWLTPRHSDEGIDHQQALDWLQDANVGNVSMMKLASKQAAAQRDKPERLDESQPGYYNDAKLVADMARPYEPPLGGEAARKGKRRGVAAAAAAARERLAADKEGRATEHRDVDVNVSDEVKSATVRVHENEGKLLEAWKREMAERTQRQQRSEPASQ